MLESTVVNFNEWKQWASSDQCSVKDTMNFELAESLSMYFTGYMTGPVALYQGEAIASRTLKLYIKQIKLEDDVETLSSQDKLFLYTIEQYDSPTTSHLTLRYALLNDKDINTRNI